MTPYTRKLHQALIDIGHAVEKDQSIPALDEIKELFYDFSFEAGRSDKKKQKKAIDKLLAALVRWEVGRL
jgi:hypothetical protein